MLYVYKVDTPTLPRHIGLAVAPFVILPDPINNAYTHFVVPSSQSSSSTTLLQSLRHTVAECTPQIFHSYESFLGCSYPFESYKQVFVEDSRDMYMPFAG